MKQVRVDVNELTIGMFVSGLDRPWTQTPFPLQGFYIRDLDEIKSLKVHCNYVYIDIVKGPLPLNTRLKTIKPEKQTTVNRKSPRAPQTARVNDVAPLKLRHNFYETSQPITKEMGRAKNLHQQVSHVVGSVLDQVKLDPARIPVKETKRVASEMVDSVLRSPDAFSWLSRVRDKDEHTYSHAVRSAVWAILFGRHIGLPKPELDVLAVGVLLKDIGKTKLPKHLIGNKNRTHVEQKAYEKFIEYGVDILRKLPDIKPRVTSVIKTHCERVNGSGFPVHLRGDKIPLLGKIAGIVTFYDETTNPRGLSPLSPSKAVAKLYESRGIEFQEELVVEFIRAIGLYPTGTLVELSSGDVAVVMEQNFARRLKPRVVVVIDAAGELVSKPYMLDLAKDEKEKRAKVDSGKYSSSDVDFIEVVQDLQPGSYNIDLNDIRSKYIDKDKESSVVSFFKKITGNHD